MCNKPFMFKIHKGKDSKLDCINLDFKLLLYTWHEDKYHIIVLLCSLILQTYRQVPLKRMLLQNVEHPAAKCKCL